MFEVEVKIRAPHQPVRAALHERDADHLGSVRQVDTYYDAPHRSFEATDEAVRVRRESEDGEPAEATDAGTLTYKGPLVEEASKSRLEVQTAVADAAATHEILSSLGFSDVATVRKTRDRYAFRGFTISLDTVEELGEFVEIESEVDTESAIEPTREEATAALTELGLNPEDQIRTSYLALLIEEQG